MSCFDNVDICLRLYVNAGEDALGSRASWADEARFDSEKVICSFCHRLERFGWTAEGMWCGVAFVRRD